MPEQVRVLLVHDSVMVLHELKTILENHKNLAIVDTVGSQAEAIAAVRECQPNVVLLDIHVGSASGIDLCKILRRTFPRTAVLFFTACDDTSLLRSAIRAGAQGYVLTSCSERHLASHIETVSAGNAVIDPALTHHIIAWIREGLQSSPLRLPVKSESRLKNRSPLVRTRC